MKNLKIVFVFSVLAMISVSRSFAQEMNSKETLALEKRQKATFSAEKNRELKVLNEAYINATAEEKVAIKEKIEVLKKEYDAQVKGVGNSALKTDKQKKDLKANKTFVLESKVRIKLAKERIAKAEANGEMTKEEAKAKRIKITKVEEKLIKHELKIKEANEKQNKK